ncbi:hypothetical protein EVAR_63230_1 [Eumeta japonica]|uniref:Uncharacterized protein n=1 Tax=Eumeta variegata TaxID=151549 RepID=A0A4C1Z9U4_EUMVA|nr:hypothetical protein EVAR_63230_1 [Eumeta japonica]
MCYQDSGWRAARRRRRTAVTVGNDKSNNIKIGRRNKPALPLVLTADDIFSLESIIIFNLLGLVTMSLGQAIVERLEQVTDLVAADAQYHNSCMKKLYQTPSTEERKKEINDVICKAKTASLGTSLCAAARSAALHYLSANLWRASGAPSPGVAAQPPVFSIV